jgi:tetratricopeptide (TPR) repeat protein
MPSEPIRTPPEALNNLGVALASAGKLEEAIATYGEALRLRPHFPEAQNNLGVALVDQGKLQSAEACYRMALQLRPDYVEAHNNLGVALFRQERIEEAIRAYREALRLKPDYAAAHVNLGATLAELGQFSEAVAHYRAALDLEPESATARQNLAAALVEQGRLQEAIQLCQELLRVRSSSGAAYFLLGELAAQRLYSFRPDEISRLEALLASPEKLSTEDLNYLHFTLAAWLDREGRYDEAFRHYRQGNESRKRLLQQQNRAYDAPGHRRFVDSLIAVFGRAWFERTRRFGLDSEMPIFVVGMPRSGSTLVQQILSSHPQVAAAGELRDLERILFNAPQAETGAGGYPVYMSALTQPVARALGQRYLQRLAKLSEGKPRVVDKMPHNYLHLGSICALFPQARIIHCRRDPVDLCLSCYCQNFKWVSYACSLEDLTLHYREYERLMDHWRAVLPLPIHEVGYEDLVARPEAVIREVIAACGLEWDSRCLAFHKNPRAVRTASKIQVRRPVYASSVGRWKRYERHLIALRNALAKPLQRPEDLVFAAVARESPPAGSADPDRLAVNRLTDPF